MYIFNYPHFAQREKEKSRERERGRERVKGDREEAGTKDLYK